MDHGTEVMCFVATARPADAARFYGEVLGLKPIADSPFALVFETGGRMLRVQKMERVTPAEGTALGWKVSDIAAEITALEARGVVFSRFPGMPQDEKGIWTTPDGSQVAWFTDPDGNGLSLTQFRD